MTRLDFTPLFRNTIGFDRMASLLDRVSEQDQRGSGYPPYNIEVTENDRYAITLAVAGFSQDEIDIQSENGVLSVRGNQQAEDKERNFLYQGIATRGFERQFQLADHVEVVGASLENGLLTIALKKEIPEAMKPKKIAINQESVLDHKPDKVA